MIVDTSVLVRVLTGDPPDQAARAGRRMDSSDGLVLTDVVLAECAHVLRSVYGLDRRSIATRLRAVLSTRSLITPDRALLEHALLLYESHPVGFPDAYLASLSLRTGAQGVLSFDRDFDRLPAARVEP